MKTVKIVLVNMFLLTLCVNAKAQETPELETYTLKNGLKIYLIKYGKIKAMSVSLSVNSGRKNETPGQQGYNSLVADMLLRGNKKYSEDEQDDKTFAIGTEFETEADLDDTRIECSFLSKDVATVFDLLSAAVLQPLFEKEKVAQYVSWLIDYNNPTKMDIAKMAHVYSNLSIHGINNPLGRNIYKQQLQQVTPEKLSEFHKFNYTPKNTRMIVCGNFNSDEIKNLIENYFGSWKSAYGEINGVSLERPSIKKQEIFFANRVLATQCALEWNKTAPEINDKQALAFTIANQLFNQVLFREIREKGGKTYSISSGHITSRFSNLMTIACSVRSNEMLNTIALFDKTLQEFSQAVFTEEEFNNEITAYKTRILSMENPAQIADFYDPILYDFEKRKNAVKDVENLKVDDIKKVIKKYFTPGSYKLVISGDENTVKDQLTQIKNLKKYGPADLELKGEN